MAAALMFCCTNNMFMYVGCDTRLHSKNARHERVWACEVCEQAAASVTCKADAAALCVVCDRDIHSATDSRGPLLRPRGKIHRCHSPHLGQQLKLYGWSTATATGIASDFSNVTVCIGHHEEDYNTDPWTPPNTITSKLPLNAEIKSMDFIFSDSENFLDFDYSCFCRNSISTSIQFSKR